MPLREDLLEADRIFGLDAARGFMMLLGVFVHSLIFVIFFGTGEGNGSLVEFYAIFGTFFTLHSFRMPAFFLLAGFFASLLIAKRGSSGFALNRAKRLGLVFLLFAPVIVPLTHITSGETLELLPLSGLTLNHLWFLYYLIILSTLMYLKSLVPTPGRLVRLQARIGSLVSDPRILWLLPVTLFSWSNVLDESGRLRTSEGLIPDLPLLFFYGMFFALGIALYKAGKSGLDALARRSYWLAILGLIWAQIGYGWGLIETVGPLNRAFALMASFYLAFGVIGIFLRLVKHESRAWAYLTKSSYWVYLVHLPIVFVLLNLFSHLGIPALPNVFLTFLCASGLSFLGYEILVRRTPLNRIL